MDMEALGKIIILPGTQISVGGLLSALTTLLICLVLIHFAMKLLRRILRNTRLDVRIQKYILMALKLGLYLIGAILVVQMLGVKPTSLVALLSVGSLGVTLAAEDILGNIAGGFLLISSRPFIIGDFIEADGVSGTVEEITLNRTRIVTLDGLTVLMPNKALSANKLVNYTALGRRRILRKVTASYNAPTETVKKACREALAATPYTLPEPAPSVYLTDYKPSSIEYSIYCWAAPQSYWDVYLGLGENLRDAFAKNGVEMTYDHLNVHLTELGPKG